MKISIIYDSKTGNTKKMAESIQHGICSVTDAEARIFSLDDIDADYLSESQGLIIGTPTYFASLSGRLKTWLETAPYTYHLSGKLAGAFATAAYVHGGADLAMQTILTHLLCYGTMVYSGGGACGNPTIHLGPVAIASDLDSYQTLFETYGQRFAMQLTSLPLLES